MPVLIGADTNIHLDAEASFRLGNWPPGNCGIPPPLRQHTDTFAVHSTSGRQPFCSHRNEQAVVVEERHGSHLRNFESVHR